MVWFTDIKLRVVCNMIRKRDEIMQKDYRETQSCLMIKCQMLGWGHQVPEMFLLSLVFSEFLKMDLAVPFEFYR